ncbi:hypothetical protein NFI96_027531 [Prochilodus magdalenae]|nr:hypothetical protein NFI96_027531 [Prochilodus magdalenae]
MRRSMVCLGLIVLLVFDLGEMKTSRGTGGTEATGGGEGPGEMVGTGRTRRSRETGGAEGTGETEGADATGGTVETRETGGTGQTGPVEGSGETGGTGGDWGTGGIGKASGTGSTGEAKTTGGTGTTEGTREAGVTGGVWGTGEMGGAKVTGSTEVTGETGENVESKGTGGTGKIEEHQGTGWTGKLLVVPMDGSHWTGLKAVAEELGRRGHMVVVVIPEVSMRLDSGKHYITKKFPVSYGQDLIDQITERTSEGTAGSPGLVEGVTKILNNMYVVMNLLTSTTESLFYNQELMDYLAEQNFDAVLTDPAMPAGAILAYNMSLPAVYMLRGLPCGMDSIATACPSPPSYVPRFFTKSSDRMCFSERVVNMLVSVVEPVLCKMLFWSFEDVATRLMHRSVSLAEILSSGALWLLRYDFTAEFPKPLMPNMVLIGGFNCAITNPLIPLEHPHTVPADGAIGVEVEGHQAFWTCDNKPFISVPTTVPPHTDSLGVSTKTKAGLVTEDDPLPF